MHSTVIHLFIHLFTIKGRVCDLYTGKIFTFFTTNTFGKSVITSDHSLSIHFQNPLFSAFRVTGVSWSTGSVTPWTRCTAGPHRNKLVLTLKHTPADSLELLSRFPCKFLDCGRKLRAWKEPGEDPERNPSPLPVR